jgi:hypothetical protein
VLAAAGFAAEMLVWRARGIRSIDLDEETVTLFRGRSLVPGRVERHLVLSVRIRTALGRRTVELIMMSGKRVRIHDDAFPAESFGQFCAALRTPSPR